jgi:hypothetical protein
VNGELVSSTPSFFASNPGKIKEGQPGPVGFELLKYEDDLGRQLAKSLTAEQRKQGFLNKDPFKDIVTGNKQKADGLIKHQGIAATALTAEQKQMLGKIIFEYAQPYPPGFRRPRTPGDRRREGLPRVRLERRPRSRRAPLLQHPGSDLPLRDGQLPGRRQPRARLLARPEEGLRLRSSPGPREEHAAGK